MILCVINVFKLEIMSPENVHSTNERYFGFFPFSHFRKST